MDGLTVRAGPPDGSGSKHPDALDYPSHRNDSLVVLRNPLESLNHWPGRKQVDYSPCKGEESAQIAKNLIGHKSSWQYDPPLILTEEPEVYQLFGPEQGCSAGQAAGGEPGGFW